MKSCFAKILTLILGATFATGEVPAGAAAAALALQRASISSNLGRADTGKLARGPSAPVDAITLTVACTAFLMNGNPVSAERLCSRAILLQPKDPAPHKLLGIAFLIEGRFAESRRAFTEAIHLAPRDPANHMALGEALRGLGDFNGSIAAFTATLQLSPRDPGVWNARCWTRGLFARQLKDGLRDRNVALRLAPKYPAGLDSRGLIYLRRGNIALAIRDYDAALAMAPDLSTALYGHGVAHFMLGRVKVAARDIALARQLNPRIDDVFLPVPLLTHNCSAGHRGSGFHCIDVGKPAPKQKPREAPLSGRSAMNNARTSSPNRQSQK